VSGWVAVSRRVRDIYAAGGIAAAVLPNFTEPRTDVPGFARREGVLYVGRLAPEKGIAHVVRSAEASPRIAHAIVGDGPERAMVEAAAGRLANLSFLGPLEKSEVESRIAGARLVLMPSLWQEPGPLTALESLANGTPVIAYPNGGLAEYVDDSQGGLVVEEGGGELADAVRTLYADRGRWEAASKRARRAAARVHSPARYAEAIEAIYLQAMYDNRPGGPQPRRPVVSLWQ
jgi:glycosyltransferase involved in cell wall biosynthesis